MNTPQVIGPLVQSVRIGTMPLLAWTVDMNGDGILDITQPEQVAKMLAAILAAAAPLIPGGAGIPLTLAIQLIPKAVALLPSVIGGAK